MWNTVRSLVAVCVLQVVGCHAADDPLPDASAAFPCYGPQKCPACVSAADCEQAGVNAGKCGEQEVFCSNGRCAGACLDRCVIVLKSANPCPDGLMCTQTETGPKSDRGNCVRRPIPCATVADCPLFSPAGGSWQCVDSVCWHAGWRYPSD